MRPYPSILVVDDEPNNFDVIEALLDGEDYELQYASSGEKAISLLETFQPDVILLDVMMPDRDGIEVCEQIKSIPKWKATPVIMVTALTAKEDLARCLAAGASDFISKPVSGLELRARVRSMVKIKQQYNSLQTLMEIREDMVHMVVHDLRTPLTTIMLAADLLNCPLPPDRKQAKVNSILQSAQRLQSLIDSLLLTAKLESGKMFLNLKENNLTLLCQSIVQDFQAIAIQKDIELISHLPENDRVYRIDASIFQRILENLLSNAFKFSPNHSKVILSVDCPESGDITIQVLDFGKGISPELKPLIFERYEVGKIVNGITQIGLGLTFCKLAIEAHGGTISVTDNQPQGTIFTLLLPTQA